MKKTLFILLLLSISFGNITAQVQKSDAISKQAIDPLKPSKAAFYSAILPGLGQAYNKKYWKVPVVIAAMGGSIYAYSYNNKKYNRYRTAFKLREAGQQDEFTLDDGTEILSRDVLVRGQKRYRKDRDLAALITVAVYALQIVEASVNAHLANHNTNRNLSFSPQLIHDTTANKLIAGLHVNFNF